MRRVVNTIKNHSNWFAYYVEKYLRNRKIGFTFETRSGISIKVPARLMVTYKECFFDDTYFKGLPNEVRNRDMKAIVDVGANVGYFSLRAFALYPNAKVISFEPMPVNFKLLNQYKSENPNFDWQAENKAMAGEETTIKLHFDQNDEFTTSATVLSDSDQADVFEVKADTLEGTLKQNNLEQIDFLKLDCEGSEYGIVYNSTPEVMKKVKAMAIETHPGNGKGENKEDMIQHLKSLGFNIYDDRDIIWAWH